MIRSGVRPPHLEPVGRWPDRPRGVVVVLHGGRSVGLRRAHRLRLAYLRMLAIARVLGRAGRDDRIAVGIVRYRHQGWNGEAMDALRDTERVLDTLGGECPDVPLILVGHSLGARAALRAAGHRSVVAVAALAPWLPPGEPVDQLAGRTVLVAHGDQERVTDPDESYAYSVRARSVTARVCRFDVLGDGHAMLRRRRDWSSLVLRFVLGEFGVRPPDPDIETAIGLPVPDGLRVALTAS